MIGFLVASAFVGYIAVFFVFFWYGLERNWPPVVVLVFVCGWLILGITIMINAITHENSKGPCVEHEIQMHYNAATKTIMPARVCVLRGEWVE